ncbi:hypothetical protein Tco_0974369 [Tanacetum coccineum]|uniref:Uncharacterized protein n=1 Tax=Tanacetum coccineum TaxID=301880 RepID=A0ABQ5EBJ0_9ASTR
MISSWLAIMDPPGDIMVPTTLLKKSLIRYSIGRLFTEMPMTWSHGVTLVNVKEKSHKGMKCHKMQSKFVRSLTFGASILWDRSRLYKGTSIYSWRSIICQNGLKQKRSPPMTPELFSNSLNLSSPDLGPLSLWLAMMVPPVDITVPTTPLKKSLIRDFIGLLFTKIPMTWSHGVTLVNVKEKSHRRRTPCFVV